jgi:hypothetical protein
VPFYGPVGVQENLAGRRIPLVMSTWHRLRVVAAVCAFAGLWSASVAYADAPPYAADRSEHSSSPDPSGFGDAASAASADRFTGELFAEVSASNEFPISIHNEVARVGASWAHAVAEVTQEFPSLSGGSYDIQATLGDVGSAFESDGAGVPDVGCGSVACIHGVSAAGRVSLLIRYTCELNCAGGVISTAVHRDLRSLTDGTLTIGTSFPIRDGERGNFSVDLSVAVGASVHGVGSALASVSATVSAISVVPR